MSIFFIFLPSASPQDLIDALKQRIRNESPPCATNYDEGLRSHKIGNQNEAMRPLKPTQLPRLIPPQNLSNYQRKDEGNVCVLFILSV